MVAERIVFPLGIRIQYGFMRFLYGRTMFSADRITAAENSKVVSLSEYSGAKTDEEVEKVFDLHGNSILRLAYSYLHNMEEAENILQETLLRYMNKAPEFESDSHEKAWLLRVATNLSKNKIDYNNIRKTDELNEELIAEEKTDLSFVWEAVKSLSENQREVIHLFYQEDYTTAQIAEKKNLPFVPT